MPSRCTEIALVLGYLTPAGATQFRGGLEKPEESAALPVFEIPKFEPKFEPSIGKYPERLEISKTQMQLDNSNFEKAPLEFNDLNELKKLNVGDKPQLESLKRQNDFLHDNGIEPREGLDILVPKHREKLLEHYKELNKPEKWDHATPFWVEHEERMNENLKLEEKLYAQRRKHHLDRKTTFGEARYEVPQSGYGPHWAVPQEVPQTADGLGKLTVDKLREKNAKLKNDIFEEGLEKVAYDKRGQIHKERFAEEKKEDAAKKAKSKKTKKNLAKAGGVAIVAGGGAYAGTKAAEAPTDNENKEDQGTK